VEYFIRKFESADWPTVWPILRATFAAGDSYTFAPDISEEEAHATWVEAPLATYVACYGESTIVGTYKLQSNQPGLGSHVCNCGYVVSPAARGKGIASLMCEHSQAEAVRLGFRAMQFNMVVVTNLAAVHLWKKHGFQIVGTLPKAFRHRQLGYVDAHVMFKRLANAGDA
jgi:ribosomal protein S18 acetylase RimI-like enzyme